MKISHVLAALLFGLVVTSCALAGQQNITDSLGRSVTVPTDIKRVVCLGPGALRLIVYLQGTDRVVGVEDMEQTAPGGRPYALAHPEFAGLPSIGPGGPVSINRKPDMEALISVHPQVVFAAYMGGPLADEVQKTLDCPVVVLSYGQTAILDDEVFNSLLIAGKVLHCEARAHEVVDFIKSARKDLQKRTEQVPPGRKPRAYMGGIGYRGAFGIESTEQHFMPFLWVNASNVAEKVKAKIGSHVFIDKERLLALDPDVIFLDGSGLSLVLEDYLNKPDFYKTLKAFRTRRIYTLLPFNSYTTNIETAIVDAFAVGKILYPECFADIDPEKKANDIYTFFVNKPVYEILKDTYGPIGGRAPFWTDRQTQAVAPQLDTGEPS